MGDCINRFFTTWRKCIRQLLGLPCKTHSKCLQVLVNDIPIDAQAHKRFLIFYESVLKSSNPIVKLCGQLVLSRSRSTVCKSLNYIWSKYNVIASKSDKNSYNTVTSMLHTYEKEKHKTYDINDQLCIHRIRELLFMRENNDFLSVAECNLMFEFFCT